MFTRVPRSVIAYEVNCVCPSAMSTALVGWTRMSLSTATLTTAALAAVSNNYGRNHPVGEYFALCARSEQADTNCEQADTNCCTYYYNC